jgi:hypothetical protein
VASEAAIVCPEVSTAQENPKLELAWEVIDGIPLSGLAWKAATVDLEVSTAPERAFV